MQRVRKSVELVFVSLLFVMGNCTFVHGKSARGALAVTAQVQTSAMWVQEADGHWKLVVANAVDPATTFVGVHRKKDSHSGLSRANAAAAAKTLSKTQNSVSHGGS